MNQNPQTFPVDYAANETIPECANFQREIIQL